MLYEMAKSSTGGSATNYEGSSGYAALSAGRTSACARKRFVLHRRARLADEHRAGKDARKTTLGSYYPVGKPLSDYQAALNEVGVIYAAGACTRADVPQRQKRRDSALGDAEDGHSFASSATTGSGFSCRTTEAGRGRGALWRSGRTTSTTRGGYGNDHVTMMTSWTPSSARLRPTTRGG